MESKSITVFDLDNTLVRSNTLKGYVEYVKSNEYNNLISYLIIFLIRFKIFFLSRLLRIKKSNLLISELKGYSKNYLEKTGFDFVNNGLNYNKEISSHLKNDINQSHLPLLISGSIREIVQPVSELLNIDIFYSSVLSYNEDNNCQGAFAVDLRGNKEIALNDFQLKNSDYDFSKSVFTTDNFEDVSCAKNFGKIRAVIHNNKAEKFWQSYTNTIINAIPLKKLTYGLIINPGLYFFKIRPDWISFILYRLGFPVFLFFSFGNVSDVFGMVLSWLCFISLYEIGYLDNDYFAVRKEKNPSLRLEQNQNFLLIFSFVAVRLFVAFLSIYILAILYSVELANQIGLWSFGILLIFTVHNRLKRNHRLVTYSILKASHLIIPTVILFPVTTTLIAVVLLYLPKPCLGYFIKTINIRNNELSYKKILFPQLLTLMFLAVVEYSNNIPHDISYMGLYLIVCLSVEMMYVNSRNLVNFK